MKSAPASSHGKAGRPNSGKKTYKVRLTPKARKAAGKKFTKLGLSDFSAYIEALIRKDNPEIFEEVIRTSLAVETSVAPAAV